VIAGARTTTAGGSGMPSPSVRTVAHTINSPVPLPSKAMPSFPSDQPWVAPAAPDLVRSRHAWTKGATVSPFRSRRDVLRVGPLMAQEAGECHARYDFEAYAYLRALPVVNGGGLVTCPDHHEIGCCRDVSLAVVLSLVTASQGTAQSVDLKGRRNAAPSFNDLGLRLWAAGALSGLGNDDVVIGRSAQGDVTSLCTNQGGNQARTPTGPKTLPIWCSRRRQSRSSNHDRGAHGRVHVRVANGGQPCPEGGRSCTQQCATVGPTPQGVGPLGKLERQVYELKRQELARG
jgi:hypothetical protein